MALAEQMSQWVVCQWRTLPEAKAEVGCVNRWMGRELKAVCEDRVQEDFGQLCRRPELTSVRQALMSGC